jgi:hypothetical protein
LPKAPVCVCGHFESLHENWGGAPACYGSTLGQCICKQFTDSRISHRLAASKSTREAGPKKEILDLLVAKKIRHFRMNSGHIHIRKGNHVKMNPNGTPDIQVIIPCVGSHFSRIFWIEVKKSDGKPSPEQIEFHREAEALGEKYLLARSAAEVEKWLTENI